jgi:hypothetical protein
LRQKTICRTDNARWLCLDCQDVVTEEQPPEKSLKDLSHDDVRKLRGQCFTFSN